MRKLIIILLGLSLLSCKVSVDGEEVLNTDEMKLQIEQLRAELKENGIEINSIKQVNNTPTKELITKESQNEMIAGSAHSGISIKHNGTEYSIDDYVHIKMEWAYFQGQTEAVTGDVRVIKQDGCWVWKSSPWDGQALNTVLYKPECGDVEVSVYETVTEEVKLEKYVPNDDIYDTDY